eukprot:m.101179 g.101179  ORF g.101179 m.101179 type:complete len:88 (-) comp16795_c0_seq7:308-571(-)
MYDGKDESDINDKKLEFGRLDLIIVAIDRFMYVRVLLFWVYTISVHPPSACSCLHCCATYKCLFTAKALCVFDLYVFDLYVSFLMQY